MFTFIRSRACAVGDDAQCLVVHEFLEFESVGKEISLEFVRKAELRDLDVVSREVDVFPRLLDCG